MKCKLVRKQYLRRGVYVFSLGRLTESVDREDNWNCTNLHTWLMLHERRHQYSHHKWNKLSWSFSCRVVYKIGIFSFRGAEKMTISQICDCCVACIHVPWRARGGIYACLCGCVSVCVCEGKCVCCWEFVRVREEENNSQTCMVAWQTYRIIPQTKTHNKNRIEQKRKSGTFVALEEKNRHEREKKIEHIERNVAIVSFYWERIQW